jgi:hypothetical protein
VLRENLIWRKIHEKDALMWISTGLMPDAEKPPYDPWNPNPPEMRIPRIYYAQDSILHTLFLDRDELPIQLLPNGKILTIRGTSYESTYQILDVDQNLGIQRTSVTQDSFRMLLGLNPGESLFDLGTGKTLHVFFQGLSTPGNLRVSILDPVDSTFDHEQILKRESSLESLLQVSGVFRDADEYSYFVQSHYDLKYYRTSSDETRSVSLNRYSYIPSLISRRLYFPLVANGPSGKRVPGIYTPASLANGDISEITFGDPKTGSVTRPALYRIKATDGCMALGNLIPATPDSPAKQVFRCNQSLVFLPVIVP